MARKKKHPEHVNHERWLISYADFITLLFAFFVVMFAVSQVDSKKLGRFTESFSKAVGIDLFPDTGQGIMSGGTSPVPGPTEKDPSELPPELRELKSQIAELEKQKALPQGLQVLALRNELVIRLSENLLFDVGDDALKEPAAKAIHELSRQLAPRKVDIRVEGHTDDRPIRTARFRSNWDLSTGRATAVVAIFVGDGIEPSRLAAAGYGQFHPLAANDTEDGRRQNRRVDIVVSVANTPAVAKSADAPEAKPAEGKHGESKPGDDKHGEGKPAEDKHGEAKPTEDKHGEGKAPEGKPSEDKHGDAKPAEGKHGDAKPAEDKHGDAKPAGHDTDKEKHR